MKVMSGKVVGGKVELPAQAVAEGEHVMIVAPQTGGPVRLTAEEEEELLQAMEEIRRGEYVEGTELIDEMRSRSRD